MILEFELGLGVTHIGPAASVCPCQLNFGKIQSKDSVAKPKQRQTEAEQRTEVQRTWLPPNWIFFQLVVFKKQNLASRIILLSLALWGCLWFVCSLCSLCTHLQTHVQCQICFIHWHTYNFWKNDVKNRPKITQSSVRYASTSHKKQSCRNIYASGGPAGLLASLWWWLIFVVGVKPNWRSTWTWKIHKRTGMRTQTHTRTHGVRTRTYANILHTY